MELITERYENQVAGLLNCFDRIVLSGNLLKYCYPAGLESYLREHKIRCFDFQNTVGKKLADSLKRQAQALAKDAGIQIKYLGKSKIRKESYVQAILDERGNHPGLVCILSCVEGCMRFMPQHFKDKNYTGLLMRHGQCLHYYFYFIDEELGLCHLRVPTWLPCRLQFCFNGHNFLANQLRKNNISFTMADNCFTSIESFETANELASIDPVKLEKRLKHYVNSFIPVIEQTFPDQYYWSIMQIEMSTDIVFDNESTLPDIYEQLVSTAVHSVKIPDVASFLGCGIPKKKLNNYGNSLKATVEGIRLRHNYGKHSIKMYDKFNIVLRIETTSNQVNLFRTRRLIQHRDGTTSMGNANIPKSIHSLPLLFDILEASNHRYHAFISTIEDHSVGRKNLKKVTTTKTENNRNYKGINFFNEADDELLLAISAGKFNITGFRNKDLRQILDMNTGKMSRSLKRLRVHGLIKKIGKTYKYYLTSLGREVITTGLKLKNLYVIPSLNFIH